LYCIRIRNCKLEISKTPNKAKSREPAYSWALKSKSIGRGSDPESQAGRQAGRQTVSRLWWMVFGA